MKYRGYTIEHYPGFDKPYLVHTGGCYGYYYFATLEAAKARIDEWKD